MRFRVAATFAKLPKVIWVTSTQATRLCSLSIAQTWIWNLFILTVKESISFCLESSKLCNIWIQMEYPIWWIFTWAITQGFYIENCTVRKSDSVYSVCFFPFFLCWWAFYQLYFYSKSKKYNILLNSLTW